MKCFDHKLVAPVEVVNSHYLEIFIDTLACAWPIAWSIKISKWLSRLPL